MSIWDIFERDSLVEVCDSDNVSPMVRERCVSEL